MLAPDLNKGDLRLKSVLCNLSQEVRNVISICSAEQGACCFLFCFFLSDSFVSDLNRFTVSFKCIYVFRDPISRGKKN